MSDLIIAGVLLAACAVAALRWGWKTPTKPTTKGKR